MGLIASDTGSGQSFDPVSEGMHHGICYGVIDLGTHYNERFGNRAHKIVIIWELPEQRIDIDQDGKTVNLPRVMSKQYTLSLHEKAILRKHLQSWRSKAFTPEELEGFDITKLFKVNCNLQVIHNKKNDKVYANIETITPLPKGQPSQAPENDILFFSFEDDVDIPEKTPNWIKDIIRASDEWQGKASSTEGDYIPDDKDIPF